MTEKLKSTPRDWGKFDAHVITQDEYDELPELTDEFFESADLYEGEKLIRAGRPKLLHRKILLSVRYSPEVVEYFRATGKGWQTRMNDALKEWLKGHAA
jgi:uncharacterized protein (DUF4415 family)